MILMQRGTKYICCMFIFEINVIIQNYNENWPDQCIICYTLTVVIYSEGQQPAMFNLPGTDTSPGIRLYDFFLPCTGTVHHWESDCMISSSPVQCTGTVHHRGSDCTISTSHVLILHRGSECTIFSSPVLTLNRVSDFFG